MTVGLKRPCAVLSMIYRIWSLYLYDDDGATYIYRYMIRDHFSQKKSSKYVGEFYNGFFLTSGGQNAQNWPSNLHSSNVIG